MSNKAIELYEEPRRGGDAKATCNLDTLYDEQGKTTEATKLYEEAHPGGDANATYNLGTLYQEQGKANYTWRDHYGIHGPGMAQVQAWPRLGAGMAQAGVSSMSHLDNIYI
jgi:TPR repeat protein